MAAIKLPSTTLRLCGGYTCQFVEELTKDLQAECSICLHTVREPHLVDCCGYRFCKTCIEPLLPTKRCPLCNGHFSTVIPDKLLQRTLNHKLVYCTHKPEGCLWTGELSKLEEHELTCPRKPVVCTLCDNFQAPLEELEQHQMKSCPARLVVCPIGCGASIKLPNVENHTENKCPNRLVVCPNGCGGTMKLSTIKNHTENECLLSVVNCEFAYAGCLQMMRRMDMKDHLELATQEHIVLLREKVKEMDSEIRRLKADNAAKDSRIRMLTDSSRRHQKAKKSAAQSQPTSSAKVLVMNLPPETTKNNIKSVFGPFGQVNDVKMRGKKMAVVEFKESASVSRALEKHHSSGISVFKTKLDVRPEH